jgi:hypothetical protein
MAGLDPFGAGKINGDAIRGRRAEKAGPCPSVDGLLNFNPFADGFAAWRNLPTRVSYNRIGKRWIFWQLRPPGSRRLWNDGMI